MREKGPLILKFIFTDGMQMDIKQAYEHSLWMLSFLLRKHSFSILYWTYSCFQTSINLYLIQEASFLQEAFFFHCHIIHWEVTFILIRSVTLHLLSLLPHETPHLFFFFFSLTAFYSYFDRLRIISLSISSLA